jgi:ribosomal protein S27E
MAPGRKQEKGRRNMINIHCPSCRRTHQAPESLAGKQVKCKNCGTVFVAEVPLVGDPAPQPVQPAPVAAGQSQPAPGVAQTSRGLRKPLLIAGGVAVGLGAVACTIIFVVIPMVSGALPGWTQAYVPEDAIMVGYVDVARVYDAIRDTETYKKQQKEVESAMERIPTKLKIEDIKDVFFAAVEKGDPVVVLRTKKDRNIQEVVTEAYEVKGKVGEIEYRSMGAQFGGCVAKTRSSTYCFADEHAMEAALKRIDKGETEKLSEKLRKGLSRVKGHGSFFAMTPPAKAGFPPEIEALAVGFSAGSSLKLKYVAVVGKTGENIEIAKKAIDLIKAVQIDYTDDTVTMSGNWSIKQLDDFAGRLLKSFSRGDVSRSPLFRLMK